MLRYDTYTNVHFRELSDDPTLRLRVASKLVARYREPKHNPLLLMARRNREWPTDAVHRLPPELLDVYSEQLRKVYVGVRFNRAPVATARRLIDLQLTSELLVSLLNDSTAMATILATLPDASPTELADGIDLPTIASVMQEFDDIERELGPLIIGGHSAAQGEGRRTNKTQLFGFITRQPAQLEGIDFGRFAWTIDLTKSFDEPYATTLALEPNPADFGGTTFHPHVSGGKTCLGGHHDAIRLALQQARWFDAFEIVTQLYDTYNPESPYRELRAWQTHSHCGYCGDSDADVACSTPGCERVSCEDCTTSRCCSKPDCKASLCHFCLSQMSCGHRACYEHSVACTSTGTGMNPGHRACQACVTPGSPEETPVCRTCNEQRELAIRELQERVYPLVGQSYQHNPARRAHRSVLQLVPNWLPVQGVRTQDCTPETRICAYGMGETPIRA